MGKGEVNPNLGLMCKPLPEGGPMIIMVKTRPGVYFDVNGDPASDELANMAGFDVAADRKFMRKEAAKAEALAKVEAQFAEESEAIEAEFADAPAEPAPAAPTESEAAGVLVETSSGEPRVVRLVDGGPVRVMEYVNGDGWKVFDRDSGEVFESGLEKNAASELLVEAA